MKRPATAIIAIILLCTAAVVALSLSPLGMFGVWFVDALTGYEFEFPAEHYDGYTITLRQEAGDDFYDSYFKIVSADGRNTRLTVDADDARWRNPQRVERDARVYYLTQSDEIDDSTSYIDLANGVLYAGYNKRTLNIDEIDLARSDQ